MGVAPARDGYATPWRQDGCLRFIRGSHRARRLLAHRTNPSPALTLRQELLDSEYDEGDAVSATAVAGAHSCGRI